MTIEPPTLTVDFNRLDDDDILWVPRDALPNVYPHQWVMLRDGDENRCVGMVRRFDARRIYVGAFLDTWQDANPVDVRVQPDALDEVLRQQVRVVTGRELTFGVNIQE